MRGHYPLWKRIMDVIGALCGILCIVPFFPFIAFAKKWESCGTVIVGLDRISAGRVIKVYKFRSMINGAHAQKKEFQALNERNDGPFFKIAKDPRVTRIGRILRRFRIDELQKLLNVLKGELALVGPRPHEPEEVQHYPLHYWTITNSRAGVTGLSQVNGASLLPYIKELEFDEWYVGHFSFLLDMKIVFKTLKIIFFDPSAV